MASDQIAPDQIASAQVATELTEFGRRGASGAMEITGHPGGIVYVRNGYLVWAESPAVPDLGTRLTGSGQLPSGVWDQIARADGPDGTIGATLVSGDFLTRAELERLLQSVVLDALLALTKPFAGECRVTGFRFVPRRSHWAETVLAMDVTMVRRYLDHMTQLLAWYDVSPRGCPQWPEGRPQETLVNVGQRAVARLIDGRTTVSELAWRGGLSLHETMASAGQLVHAGLCIFPAQHLAPGKHPALAEHLVPAGRCAVPDRLARPVLPRRGPVAGSAAAPQVRATPLELGLLQRVRQGLEGMA
jgi:hypothetical protein